ncbi:MerR family transcriptional regulator [Saccharomonospora piscinae]|uniref:MerR family transcriptional regulator n=1 Tax=Saccharomonospora piscinae TaxID=687388 RepID=UPI001106BE33|nr:MerR family transcriptional regulator [Saccharomonospora piscinae]TLW93909.1 MerR family transcriptional regulator [Saccharomonospora piscinae]
MFTIGELSRRTGLPVKTIRFYSDEGLLPPTDRTRAGYRLYDTRALARLELVRTLRELGIGLAEIRAVLGRARRLPELAAKHVEVLDEQIHVLRTRRAVLRAVMKRQSEPDEVRLMNKLAAMSDEQRKRLVDDFWHEVTDGLDVNPEFYDRMRQAKPELPDDPTPEQLEAWIEFAELVRDPDFRALIRGMSEQQAAGRERDADTGGDGWADALSRAQAQRWGEWSGRAQAALDAGTPPGSGEGRALADEIAREGSEPGESDGPALRHSLADRIGRGADARAERYWQLLATINGWPPIPARVPAALWIVEALRASAD